MSVLTIQGTPAPRASKLWSHIPGAAWLAIKYTFESEPPPICVRKMGHQEAGKRPHGQPSLLILNNGKHFLLHFHCVGVL